MEIREAIDEFLLQLEADGRSIHTRGNYARHLLLLCDWLRTERACREIEAVTHRDLAAFLASPQARTRRGGGMKKPSTTNALRTSIRAFFRYHHATGAIPEDPSRMIRRAVCSPPPPRALSEDEERRLLAAMSADPDPKAVRDHALFATMLATGIRVGSAVALRVEDVDLAAGELWVRVTKRSAPERVFLPTRICEHLRDWIGERTVGALFPGHVAGHMTPRHAGRRLAGWLAKAGIHRVSGSHCTRHTLATRLYAKTHDLLLVRQALRHRSISSTVRYAEFADERLREALG